MSRYLLIVIFLITSCRGNETQRFENALWEKIIFAYDFKVHREEVKKNQEIERPYYTKGLITSFDVINEMGGREKLCLLYRTPNKMKSNGRIFFGKMRGKCDLYSMKKKQFEVLSGVKKLKVFLSKGDFEFQKGKNSLGKFHLYLSFIKDGRQLKWKIPMVNLRGKVIFRRYSSIRYPSLFMGMNLDYYHEEIKKKKTQGELNLGSPDNFKICLKLDLNCSIVLNECDRCLYNVLPVVGKNCNGKKDLFCSSIDCGGEGGPACFRGTQVQSSNFIEHCFDGSPLGFCRDGLVPICDKLRKILICR